MTEEKYKNLININIDCQCQMTDKWHDCNQSHGYIYALVINILQFCGNTLKTNICGFPLVLLYMYMYMYKYMKIISQTFQAFMLLIYDSSMLMLIEICYHVLACMFQLIMMIKR